MQLVLWRKQKLSSIFIVCVVLIVVFVCLRLSYWQVQRAEAKVLQLAHIERLQNQGVMQWSHVQTLPVAWNKTGIKVTFTGRIADPSYWLLDNQIYQGQVGYDVLVLFTPTGSQFPVIVNLGWVKAPLTRQQLPTVNLPEQPIEMTVQLKQGELSGFTLENSDAAMTDGWPKRIQNIDLDVFAKQTGEILADYIGYRQGAGDELGIPHYQAVVMSPQKHYGYAVQWFLIGLACVGVAVFASKKKDLK